MPTDPPQSLAANGDGDFGDGDDTIELADWQADSTWPRALTLPERLGLALTDDLYVDDEELARTRRRLERWRGQAPFDDPRWWQRRLEFDGLEGLDESTLERRLSVAAEMVSPAPEWISRLHQIYSATWDGPRPGSVFCCVEPLLGDGRHRLRALWPELAGGDLEADLMRLLGERLHRQIGRTLVLELRIAGLEERLVGDTPEERFQNFHTQLRTPSQALLLLREYPVLARSLIATLDAWLTAVDELLRHAEEDRARLGELLCAGDDPGPPVAVAATGGDAHRDGRSVLRVRFASGAVAAYKPRSMAPEVVFAGFLTSLREALGSDTPWVPDAIDRGDHGWMPWLETQPCESEAQVERFYRRQGVLLAILHVLGTTDLHFENLLAVGGQPVIVDLETLAHPLLPPAHEDPDDSGLADSVLRVGLLPHRLLLGDDAIDLSGLGADSAQKLSKAGMRFTGAGTDQMSVVPTSGSLGDTPGRPRLGDHPVQPEDYAEAILAGFRVGRQALTVTIDHWLADEGGLERLWPAPIRVVLRPTQVYALLLSEAFHPQALRDAAERDLLFDRLWLGIRRQPRLTAVFDAEHADLQRGDVPLFTSRVNSRHLWDASGNDLGPLLPESAAEGIRRRAAALGSDEDQRQATLIETAFELRATEQRQRPRPRSEINLDGDGGGGKDKVDRDLYLRLASQVGDRLAENAFRGRYGARWMVPRKLDLNRWTLAEAGPDLYYGTSGIAIFFASLAALTGEARHGALADEAIVSLSHNLALEDAAERSALGLDSAGAFDGLGAAVYALVHLAHWRQRPDLLDLAEQQLERLASAVEQDRNFDIVAGAAGALLAAKRLATAQSSCRALELVDLSAQHLIEHAEHMPDGIGWRSANGGVPLAGMAHGAAGIAWALAEASISSAPNDGTLIHGTLIHGALDYEDSLLAASAGNWRDLRPRPEGARDDHLVAWCHGAAGVGLARLALQQALADSRQPDVTLSRRLERDIQLATGTTQASGFGLGHCLCHGDLGNVDLLIEVASARQDAELQQRAGRLGAAIAASIEAQGPLFGTPGGTRPPGMMVGLAGIGYGLLRLAAPQRVPSLLRLAPPPEAA